MRIAVIGVDGGNSKADVALATADGAITAAVRVGTVSHQMIGLEAGMALLNETVRRAADAARLTATERIADVLVATLAGADYASDVRLLSRALSGLHLAGTVIVANDTLGAFRAGASRTWGICLVCGHGINAIGIAPDGRRAGFPAVGDIAGDWGGAGSIGMAGLAAAIRGRDGRGPRTSLERQVPAHFGLARPSALTRAMYEGRISQQGVGELSPLVFAAAVAGDAVARSIVDQLADELARMATALIHRLHVSRLDPEIVLAGGVFRTGDPDFYARLEGQVRAVCPRATFVRSRSRPVAGALLLGLDRISGGAAAPEVAERVRREISDWDRGLQAATTD
jgi:N-acetylglucosamine kinase-like BadF-type ATPase